MTVQRNRLGDFSSTDGHGREESSCDARYVLLRTQRPSRRRHHHHLYRRRRAVAEQCAGWIEHSCGYHGDDGKKFGPEYRARGAGYGPVFGSGDVVGCGFRPKSGEIFFTKNKIYLGMFSS